MDHRKKRLFIIDAMALAFRSFYAFGMGRQLSTASGIPTSVVLGSANFMNKLLTEQKPDYLVVATDSKEPTFRHKIYPQYKANRTEMPPELAQQLPYFFRLMEAYGCPVIKEPGLEADDLIGSLAKKFASSNLEVFIVSGDKDFMQLVDDKTFLFVPKKGDDAVIIDRTGVKEKFGCEPEQVIDCLAIIGDTSDNVPGVHGIGEKGAAKLISEYKTLEGVYSHLESISNKKHKDALTQDRDNAFLSKRLVTIHTEFELPYALADLECHDGKSTANPTLLSLFKELEIKSLTAKVEAGLLKLNKAEQPRSEPIASPSLHDDLPRAGYQLVASKSSFSKLLHDLDQSPVFAFDTETTGLNIISDKPIGISFSTEHGKGYYVPLIKENLFDLNPSDVISGVKKYFEDDKKLKVAHNIKFDYQMLLNVGLEVKPPMVDTMLCDWLLDSGLRQHGLDQCCLKYLNLAKIPTSALIGTRGEISMLSVDIKVLTDYAVEDADYTLRLYHHLNPLITSKNLDKVLFGIEMPLVPILAKMERTGIYIDTPFLKNLSRTLTEKIEALEDKIYELAGESFNINSPKQLANILFERLKIHEEIGLKTLKKTKTGYSTDESVLLKLKGHPLADAILEFRGLTKLKGTYVDALPLLVNPETKRVHGSFHQTGTATGRLSSSDPNLQNIPIRSVFGQEVRKAFRSNHPGWKIISADYSQIELRILAHMANEQGLKEAYNSGQDIHRATASRIFGVPPTEVNDLMRSRAKAINFGIIYGMGAKRLAEETGASVKEASEFIEKYFSGYPQINTFINESIKEAQDKGYVQTITGRRRIISGLNDLNRRNVINAENIAVNSRIQGSAADLIKLAMIEIDRQITQSNLPLVMLSQVHDELLFECAPETIDEATTMIRRVMSEAMQLSVPLEIGIGVGDNWLEAH